MKIIKILSLGAVIVQFSFLRMTIAINTNSLNSVKKITNSNYKSLQTGTFYLNHNRPLWILQDENMTKPNENKRPLFKATKEKEKYDHIKPIFIRNQPNSRLITNGRYANHKVKAQKRITFYNNRKHLKLPANYIPHRDGGGRGSSYTRSDVAELPTFDSLPGDDTYENSSPIFVYTGQRGRLLFNTMMSGYQYPMREPIPGQTLRPPRTLLFKSDVEENVIHFPETKTSNPIPQTPNRIPGSFNVTMIPFYAYEAIDPRMVNLQMAPTKSLPPLTTLKPKRFRKIKKYKAFYSPEDILAQPFNSITTTNQPITLDKPWENHKLPAEDKLTTTPLPHKKLEVTYNDGEDKFRITYEDDVTASVNLERPPEIDSTIVEPQTSETIHQDPWSYGNYEPPISYNIKPIYDRRRTYNDKKDGIKHNSTETKANREDGRIAEVKDINADSNKSKENTWFILNSRYKGPIKSKSKNLHSSKYVQTTRSLKNPVNVLKGKQTTAKETNKLQPQMRALYGDKIEIVM
ncbi:uncharacterized protein LOC142229968 [Haematobia irritans]|uniref:uncharacterized protein LOC142229968 n=1 Tax=Haematobia irritans TaxID=7368 RepID=UPI003F4F5321